MKEDIILTTEFGGSFKGLLNFSILTGPWILNNDDDYIKEDDEFHLPLEYFKIFEINSTFKYHDTCDPTSIYIFKLVRFHNNNAILKIEKIFLNQGDM